MGIGLVLPSAGAGFDADNRFVYDNLVTGAQVEVPWDGTDQAIDLTDPTDGDEWANPAGWWAAGSPKQLTLPTGVYAVSLDADFGLAGGGVDVIRVMAGTRPIRPVVGITSVQADFTTYVDAETALSVEFWPDDETSSYFVKLRLEVLKIG